MKSVAIIGGGIAGLTAAYALHKAGVAVTVLEATSRVGGVIHSERHSGYLVETGPNTIQSGSPALDQLIEEMGLSSEIVEANPSAKRRYVVRNGAPVGLPSGPPDLLTTPLFSPAAKLRILKEPFIPPAPLDTEESVASFVERRLGREIMNYVVDPFVAGIFAGDPSELSVRHAFPRLYGLEQQSGSLLKGMLKRMQAQDKTKPQRRRMYSFKEGMAALPEAIAARLSEKIKTDAPVTMIQRTGKQWTVSYSVNGQESTVSADAVLLTAPLHRMATLRLDKELPFTSLNSAVYAPVRIVALGYQAQSVEHPLDGFGVLVPSAERDFRILGALFSSTLFPDRAPEGHVLLTTFLGGQRHPDLALASEDEAAHVAHRDLAKLLGIQGEPAFTHHVQWTQAIPQYQLGYGAIKDELNQLEGRYPGLFFAGNYRNGISVADTISTARSVAEGIRGYL